MHKASLKVVRQDGNRMRKRRHREREREREIDRERKKKNGKRANEELESAGYIICSESLLCS